MTLCGRSRLASVVLVGLATALFLGCVHGETAGAQAGPGRSGVSLTDGARGQETSSLRHRRKTYYVNARTGRDGNKGTSRRRPWKTLEKANRMLRPGDRLLLRRGQAWAGDLTVTASGTAERPISIGGYGRGPRAAIRGGLNCIVLTGSYVVIRGVWVDSCRFAGIRIIGSSNTVESSLITGNAVGVQVRPGAQGARILHNEIRDNNRMSRLTRTPNNDDSGAFGIVLAGEGAEVAYNTISGSDSFSYDYGRDGSAIEVFGGRDNWIHHNLAVDNHAFSELGGPGTANNTYSWNVVRASLSTAAFLTTRGTGGRYGPVLRTTLYHNTAYLTGSGSRGVSCSNGCGPSILRMRDNIVVAMQWAGSADAPFDENDDVFWGGSTKFQMGAASVFADPLFADPGNGNLRLQASSPAVDAGVDVGGSADFDGHPVPLDGNGDGMARPDIGAFEYVPGSG